MNYLHLMQKGLRLVVKEALKEVSLNGLLDGAFFYITFKTNFPGVIIPKHLIEKFPERMTIVLMHEFWDLEVYEDSFSVSLIFNSILENLTIPFNSIYRFEDPNEPIALDFLVDAVDETKNEAQKDNIISLDKFRKNNKNHLNEPNN